MRFLSVCRTETTSVPYHRCLSTGLLACPQDLAPGFSQMNDLNEGGRGGGVGREGKGIETFLT